MNYERLISVEPRFIPSYGFWLVSGFIFGFPISVGIFCWIKCGFYRIKNGERILWPVDSRASWSGHTVPESWRQKISPARLAPRTQKQEDVTFFFFTFIYYPLWMNKVCHHVFCQKCNIKLHIFNWFSFQVTTCRCLPLTHTGRFRGSSLDPKHQ